MASSLALQAANDSSALIFERLPAAVSCELVSEALGPSSFLQAAVSCELASEALGPSSFFLPRLLFRLLHMALLCGATEAHPPLLGSSLHLPNLCCHATRQVVPLSPPDGALICVVSATFF
ncbi:hypothetical protein GOP47_0027868 [Adiantum capillus-veneris]|nr:hypothetical protein GOP47_0027867 [Adiantum capillus-veneris]KAI5057853.1 hypothetical protein GOP47_0027868 [Adiantum capillus-veneris]